MIREINFLLKLKLQKTISPLINLYNNNADSLYELYDLILEAPFENIWFETINNLFGYCKLVAYLFDGTVSSIFIITPFSFYLFGIK